MSLTKLKTEKPTTTKINDIVSKSVAKKPYVNPALSSKKVTMHSTLRGYRK